MSDTRDFFISFIHANAEIATAINDALNAAGFSTWFHPKDKPKGAGIADWMEVALDASNQMLALCSDAYFDRSKGYSRAERQSMFWEDPTNNDPLLILVKVAPCKFPRLIAQNEYIDLTGLQRPEAAAKLVAELQSEKSRQARLAAENIDRTRQLPDIFNVQGGLSPHFSGRTTELALLHERIKSNTATPITAVQGMGGIGKTTLAREYAHRFGTAARFGGVWWAEAETQSGILNAYDRLAQRLGNQFTRDPDQEKNAANIRDWLGAQPDSAPWLIIFDNAPDAKTVANWLPKGSARVIVTTRYDGFDTIATKLSLDFWDVGTTIAFLQERTGRGTDTEAQSLAERLDGLPLAAEQAGAYLAENSTLAFKAYDDRLTEMLDKAPEVLPGGYDKSLYATFRTALEAINEREHGETALGLINLCAYLSPDGVELEVLKACAKASDILPEPLRSDLTDEVQCAKAVASLTKYALIRVGEVPDWGQTLILHRLLGDIGRDLLDKAAHEEWSTAAVLMIQQLMPNDVQNTPSVWPLCARLTPHAQAMRALNVQPGTTGRALAYVLNQAAVYLDARGDFDGAITLLRRCVELGKVVFQSNPKEVAIGLGNLAGRLEKRKERWDESEAIYAEALEILEATLAPDDPSIATTLSNMASIPQKKNEFYKAENLHLRAAKIDKAAHGAVSTKYATRLNNLSTVYYDWANATGDPNLRRKERDTTEEAAQIIAALRGIRHPGTAACQNNLAVMHANTGNISLAAKLMARAVTISLSLDQQAHPDTQHYIRHLIFFWEKSGQYDKAARLRAGDGADIFPIVAEIEAEHRAWVAEDPDNREFGLRSPITGATA